MASRQEVYKGFWTNWIDGRVQGATLTLDRESGAYLIAFLALFVHITGASFWRLASFVIFYFRSHPDLDNIVILQQQTVFRNSASAISSLRGFFRIAIRSRDWKKSFPVILWAGINLIGFLAAGVLSSRVTSTRSDVLLKPTHCGQWTARAQFNPDDRDNFVMEQATQDATRARLETTSEKYAAVCYNRENSPEGCITFGRRPPTWTKNVEASCPFKDDLCIDNLAVTLDSGYIASDLDLGINSNPSDRISIRHRLSCAPLRQDGYTQIYHGAEVASLFPTNDLGLSATSYAQLSFNEPLEHHKFDAFFYGPSVFYENLPVSPATFIFNNASFAYSVGGEGDEHPILLSCSNFEFLSNGSLSQHSTFDPITSLKVPEHQVTLFFLSTNAVSSGLVTDPWFKTDHAFEALFFIDGAKPRNYTLYKRRPVTTVLACAEKFELCRGTSNDSMHCVVTDGRGQPYEDGDLETLLGLNHRQTMIAHRLRQANDFSNLPTVGDALGGAGLLAYESLGTGLEAPLPHNQWILEVDNWFATLLTIKQAYTTQYVTGLPDKRYNKYLVPPSKSAEWMCHNQIVQRTDHASFSVLGISIILILGGFFIALNAVISRISGALFPHSAKHQFRGSSWDSNELLELHAEAFGYKSRQDDDSSAPSEKMDTTHDEQPGGTT